MLRNIKVSGYKAGYKDALENKSKNAQRHLSKWKAVLLPYYLEVFIEGYELGFKEGVWKRTRQKHYKEAEKKAKMAYNHELQEFINTYTKNLRKWFEKKNKEKGEERSRDL